MERGFYAVHEKENCAWEIKDNGTGEVAAYVDCLTERVFYCDPEVKNDPKLQEMVNMLKETETHNSVHITLPNQNGAVTLQMKTERGLFEATAEPKALFDGEKDAMYISFQPSEDPYVYVDFLAAKTDGKDVEFYLWSDIADEDYQGDPIVIPGEEIDDLVDSCRKQIT